MSRIGNAPIPIPSGVKIKTEGQTIAVEGPKGTLSFEVPNPISFAIEGEEILFQRPNEERKVRALHGMSRAMTNNMVVGCSEGFVRTLEIIGVGYRVLIKGRTLDLTLGFSHPISYSLPDGVDAETDKEGKLHLRSANKALLGSVAADIRRFRPPEPYKGKGVRYLGERIIRKEGKARGKK